MKCPVCYMEIYDDSPSRHFAVNHYESESRVLDVLFVMVVNLAEVVAKLEQDAQRRADEETGGNNNG